MGFEGDEYIGFDELRRRRYAHDYQAPLDEYENFSADQAWMPNVVLMAKSTYVWLEQLSKKYLRHIHRLPEIPTRSCNCWPRAVSLDCGSSASGSAAFHRAPLSACAATRMRSPPPTRSRTTT